MKIMTFMEIICTSRHCTKELIFLHGISPILNLVMQHGRTWTCCKLCMSLRSSLVHHPHVNKLQQDLWNCYCSLSCGVCSTLLHRTVRFFFCHLVRNQWDWALGSSGNMLTVWILLFPRKIRCFEPELQLAV